MQRWQEEKREPRQYTGDCYQAATWSRASNASSSGDIIHDALSNEFGVRDVIACTNISAWQCDSITGSLMELFMRGL
ncbi:uncharacterized [Tachysurus ichikawai]